MARTCRESPTRQGGGQKNFWILKPSYAIPYHMRFTNEQIEEFQILYMKLFATQLETQQALQIMKDIISLARFARGDKDWLIDESPYL